jgi:ATP-binding cassette subfamily B protein/subfamily B ATP-binding cassette protein MsbA
LFSVRSALRRISTVVFGPLLDQKPASKLIRRTSKEQWKLIVVNIVSSLLEAFSEGATFAVIFLAVEVLTSPSNTAGGVNWSTKPLVSSIPLLTAFLEGIPRTTLFSILLGSAVVLQGIQSINRYINMVTIGYFAARCNTMIRGLIHGQILSLSYSCASAYQVGDLTSYAINSPVVVKVFIEQFGSLFICIILIVTYLGILISLSPWLLLAALVLGGILVVIQNKLLPRIRAGSRVVTQQEVIVNTLITEDIQGLRLLHSTGQLDAADQRCWNSLAGMEAGMRRQTRLLQMIGPISSFLPVTAIALIAALSLLVFGTKSTGVLPSLVTFVLALQRLNVRFSTVANAVNTLSNMAGGIDRLNEILSPAGKQFRPREGVPFDHLHKEIRLEQVDLRYPDTMAPALQAINLSLPVGHTLALVGSSGAGKSSIADLLVGLYEPTSGRVLIDGRDLRDLDRASWQQRLGVVSQDTFLFNTTLADNIAFGSPWASQAQIEAAAEQAQAADFIAALPQGYATSLGERGYRLSGGQRQRISLARAILRDPDLLILDEATSALDSQSERLVQEALDRFEGNRTVLVIAHRLSTIVNADQICVMEKGRLVQQGRHHELLAEAGPYARLWQEQANQPGASLPS